MLRKIKSIDEFINENLQQKVNEELYDRTVNLKSFRPEEQNFIRRVLNFDSNVKEVYAVSNTLGVQKKDFAKVTKSLGSILEGPVNIEGVTYTVYQGNGNSPVVESKSGNSVIYLMDADAILEGHLFESENITPEDLTIILEALPELEKLIFKRIGMKVKLSAELNPGRTDSYIRISSGDLMKEYGNNPIVKACFAKWNLYFWGGTKIKDNEFWFNPKCSYEHPSGGQNGTDFIWDSLWLQNGKWVEGRVIV